MVKNRENLRIVFMGTPEFAKCSLEALVKSGFTIVGVFTNPDKASGRGMAVKMSPVKEYAISKDIPVFEPAKVRNNTEVMEILERLKPDLICVTAYGKILPKEVLYFPKYGSINVHGSLLPKYRGAAPIQWSIINGESVTGITTMYMNEGMDTGDMLLKEEVAILDNDNYETLHDKLKIVGADLLVKTIDKLLEGTLERIVQVDDEANYAPMISKEITKIDFTKSAKDIFNFVRGLSPYPATFFLDENLKRYKVYEVSYDINVETFRDFEVGQICNISKDHMQIKCSNGVINVVVIQPENSKKMNITEFLKSSKFKVGDKLK
ncbi:MAG: methionyl-tRNA formyltransferase [Clostridia bacterium]|nr:methionyl-tRNA formyltransferase [Clostridia bacterium]